MNSLYIAVIIGAILSTLLVLFIIKAVQKPLDQRDRHSNGEESDE